MICVPPKVLVQAQTQLLNTPIEHNPLAQVKVEVHFKAQSDRDARSEYGWITRSSSPSGCLSMIERDFLDKLVFWNPILFLLLRSLNGCD